MWQDKNADIKIKLNKLPDRQVRKRRGRKREREREGADDKVLIVSNFYAFDPRERQYFLCQLMANESKRSRETATKQRKRERKSGERGTTSKCCVKIIKLFILMATQRLNLDGQSGV